MGVLPLSLLSFLGLAVEQLDLIFLRQRLDELVERDAVPSLRDALRLLELSCGDDIFRVTQVQGDSDSVHGYGFAEGSLLCRVDIHRTRVLYRLVSVIKNRQWLLVGDAVYADPGTHHHRLIREGGDLPEVVGGVREVLH